LLRDAASDVVLVRSPHSEQLRALVVTSGATARDVDHGGIEVSGLSASEIGELAAGAGIALHELTPQQPSLEAAFLELTEGAVQFRGREAHA
jgi:ABC-2 type transport system ATP-binding protein